MENLKKEEMVFMRQIKTLENSKEFGRFLNFSLKTAEGVEKSDNLLKNDFGKFRAKFEEGLKTYTELL